ncbi:hypothetical protein ACFV9C_30880 [Kribbella sp. NPDC059898]|uniref:hypothetical protein n=1 Tax=Kribbella sp. NPDC059898 TaxID=3346995 RepID=UPI003658D410
MRPVVMFWAFAICWTKSARLTPAADGPQLIRSWWILTEKVAEPEKVGVLLGCAVWYGGLRARRPAQRESDQQGPTGRCRNGDTSDRITPAPAWPLLRRTDIDAAF